MSAWFATISKLLIYMSKYAIVFLADVLDGELGWTRLASRRRQYVNGSSHTPHGDGDVTDRQILLDDEYQLGDLMGLYDV